MGDDPAMHRLAFGHASPSYRGWCWGLPRRPANDYGSHKFQRFQ